MWNERLTSNHRCCVQIRALRSSRQLCSGSDGWMFNDTNPNRSWVLSSSRNSSQPTSFVGFSCSFLNSSLHWWIQMPIMAKMLSLSYSQSTVGGYPIVMCPYSKLKQSFWWGLSKHCKVWSRSANQVVPSLLQLGHSSVLKDIGLTETLRLSRSRATWRQFGIDKHILISLADILTTSKHSGSSSESSDSVVRSIRVLGGGVGGGRMFL